MSKPFHLLPACVACILVLVCFFSCTTTNRAIPYFQTITRDTILQQTVTRNFDLKIKPDDLLSISISSASAELSGLFNTSQGGASSTGGISGGYLVDKKGNIQLYKLGEVKVAGLTRDELKEKLQAELGPYLKEPVVTVRFANHRFTVLGEVGSPGVYNMTNDQVNLLEALGQSGDLTEDGKRSNVLVIRQTDNGKEFRHLNLMDHSVFTSPYFYLQNEDVIYVEPDQRIKEQQKKQQLLTYVLSALSVVTIIVNLVR